MPSSYASADAYFCIQEINIGMVADVGTLQRLPKLIPLGVVHELAYTGRRLGADKAHVSRVVRALMCFKGIDFVAAVTLVAERMMSAS